MPSSEDDGQGASASASSNGEGVDSIPISRVNNPSEPNSRNSMSMSMSTQPPQPASETSVRQTIGTTINKITDVINDNIIIARYGTLASITLLTVYGISKTPLFFRYKRVADIPSSLFSNRRTIHGRIVHISSQESYANGNSGAKELPIVCLVRHSSPIGRMLNKRSSQILEGERKNENEGSTQDGRDLLRVEIAGIKTPPFYYAQRGGEGANDWLKNLAAKQTPVSCTLISRRVLKVPLVDDNHTSSGAESVWKYQQQQSFYDKSHQGQEIMEKLLENPDSQQVAICQIKYRPGMSIFKKDLASSLVHYGRASLASAGMHVDGGAESTNLTGSSFASFSMPTTTIDGSTKLGDISKDVKYLEQLESNELDAVKESRGMWADKTIRELRPDLVEEVDFELHAPWWKKLWRKVKRE